MSQMSIIKHILYLYHRLIGDFAEKCEGDIKGANCGRISQKVRSDAKDIFVQHSQVGLCP